MKKIFPLLIIVIICAMSFFFTTTPYPPTFEYQNQENGNYTVDLTVTTASGSDTEIKTNYIQVSPTPVIDPDPALPHQLRRN